MPNKKILLVPKQNILIELGLLLIDIDAIFPMQSSEFSKSQDIKKNSFFQLQFYSYREKKREFLLFLILIEN